MRTVAVFAVILYHAKITLGGWQLLPGGYLGVDIFFVISGYLITTLLMTELVQSERISVLNFYERRARRLLPGLLVVMLVSLPFAWKYLLPDQLVEFSKSLISSLLFSSNFYWNFSLQQYGAESALLQPFLHTWSLAVEEQYYIVFPLLLFAIYKYGRQYLAMILMFIMVLNLLYAQWMTGRDESFSFYMILTRFWELLSGSLLALVVLKNLTVNSNSLSLKAMPSLGIILIVGSLVCFDFEVHHPGFITLIPIVGTILVIYFKRENDWVTRGLSRPTMVYLGLLSYSLYLWHYPIFAFGRMEEAAPSFVHKSAWIFLTLCLSMMSYHLVEKPFRSRRISRRKLVYVLVLVSMLVITISLYWIKGEGIPGRGDFLGGLIQSAKPSSVQQGEVVCHSGGVPRRRMFGLGKTCIFENHPGAPTLILVGDSHAGMLAGSIKALASENKLNFVQVTQVGCPHLVGQHVRLCRERSDALRSYLGKFSSPTIIYNSRLPFFLEQRRFDNQEGRQEIGYRVFTGTEGVSIDKGQRSQAVITTLNGWLEDGYRLVIVYPVPEQGFNTPRILKSLSPPPTNVVEMPTLSTDYEVFKNRVASSYAVLDRVKNDRVSRVYPEFIFCREKTGRCVASESDRLYFISDNHVGALGSDLIVREVAVQLGLQVPKSFRK